MEGTIGEIRIFAANFAPKNWASCEGQLLPISSNTALFSILGVQYGGNGTTTFALPDLRGRTALGVGQGPGLGDYPIGERIGTENVTLLTPQMPIHSHAATAQVGTVTATGTLYGVNSPGGQDNPGGNFIGEDNGAGATPYAASGTPVAMNAGAITVTDVVVPPPSVTVGPAGSTSPHPNMQPSLAMYYIICMYGVFPARN
ncbi:microcystin dependent MdpB family protein [Parapedobacter defluvii]|uniref:Microcystin dependent MdpB family protein n=1 Tax=Parapedobacter defluvii TaxID=2045106 RepID=A0ABQ1MEV2_9SPHI|nr:tail fiber protein [Parapedobacter defluvii]GGC39372.1 microcystin dependent MdpB family protein [Parapedobacter defluvii]